MSEDMEPQIETTEAPTGAESQGYGEILNGQGAEPEVGPSGVPEVTEEPLTPEDPEFVFREGFKAKLSEVEEWKKGYLRQKDYTQKTQEIGQQRKSLEQAFGKMPQSEELASLGKLYQAYFQNPEVAQAVDAILSGQPLKSIFANGPQDQAKGSDDYTKSLESTIQNLESRLNQFESSFEEREQSKIVGEAQKSYDSWAAEKKKAGIEITQEIDAAMSPFVAAIKQRNPDWDANKILNEAYRHATIDQMPQKIAQEVLGNADSAKKNTAPKITPRAQSVPESSKSYADLMLNK